MYGYAGHFAHSEQTVDDLVAAVGVLSDGLTMNVGGDTTHHVMAGRYDRHRCDDRIDMSEGLRQLTDARQAAVQHFLTQVIQLQHHVVAIRPQPLPARISLTIERATTSRPARSFAFGA